MDEQQQKLLEKLGIAYDPSKPLKDDDKMEIEEKVSDYLERCCFDKQYHITEEGKICESILDRIAEV